MDEVAFERLMVEIITNYANLLIEDDDSDDEVDPSWPMIQRFFREGFGVELQDRPRANSPLGIVDAGK